MKKQYQIQKQKEKQAAAQRFASWAGEQSEALALLIPRADIAALAQQSLGDLLRSVFKTLLQLIMEDEVNKLVGPRSKTNPDRDAYRWGRESGFCVIDGQRVPIDRPRVRSRQHNREIPLGSYELFQRASLLEESVWHKVLYGLSTRHYKEVVQQFSEAYGLEKSSVSRHFVAASQAKLRELMKRSLKNVPLAAILIDGTIFQGEHLIVALGIDPDGRKLVLGIRQGATENSTVVGALLGELAERGVDFSQPRLYLVDGSKAIQSAIRCYAGEAAFFQRCQVHKISNVTRHLSQEKRHAVKFQMRRAYNRREASEARQALYELHEELEQINPSAAAALAEGLEDTLTVMELGIAPKLRRSLTSTNAIESGFSMVDHMCGQVKRWQGGNHRLRWIGSALIFAESRWKRLDGYRHMPVLQRALERAYLRRCGGNSKEAVHAA